MKQHPLGERVWEMVLRELQVKHLDENELSLFYNSLEDAIQEVLDNYEVDDLRPALEKIFAEMEEEEEEAE